ncbi:beta-defensin 136 [Sus scrofa]|uniref:Defensin beta 136 n=2 Tax=Sus scrofa TaxID=9823 RepID=A0A8D0J6N0_PIG|nr:beta-defensin 136 [Sus scrofa]
MRLRLSWLLFLLLISLPSGNGLIENDGVEIHTCTVQGGRCFFGCKIGWEWVSYCHSILSCCVEIKKNPPPQIYEA